MASRFLNKNVVITGAASGMGSAIARAFAGEGANLVLGDINIDGLKELAREIKSEFANEVITVKCDVADSSDAQNLISNCVESFGEINVLVNNAGIGLFGTVVEFSEEDWDKEIDVNLKGVFLCSKYAVKEMLRTGGGSIINTSSGAGIFGTPGSVAYCASKGGVVLLTKAMALDHAKDNIRINSVAPGIIDTPFNQKILDNTADPAGERKAQEDFTPIGRLGTPEEIARAILFVASSDASYMTGAVVSVDGGLSAM